MEFTLSSVTDSGKEAIKRATDHEYPLIFTELRVGSGIYSEAEDVSARTELKSEKNTYAIGGREDSKDGTTVNAVLTNFDGEKAVVTETYNVNEIGLYCTVNGKEYLYAVAAIPDGGGQEMPAYDGNNLTQIVQEWLVATSNDLQIDVEVAGVYARQSELDELKEMIANNHYRASVTDESGNVIVDENNNEIAGNWRYAVV